MSAEAALPRVFLVLYSRSYRWPCKSFSRFHFVFSFRSDSSQIYLNVLGNSIKFGFLETLQLLVSATADAGIIAAADILAGSTCTCTFQTIRLHSCTFQTIGLLHSATAMTTTGCSQTRGSFGSIFLGPLNSFPVN